MGRGKGILKALCLCLYSCVISCEIAHSIRSLSWERNAPADFSLWQFAAIVLGVLNFGCAMTAAILCAVQPNFQKQQGLSFNFVHLLSLAGGNSSGIHLHVLFHLLNFALLFHDLWEAYRAGELKLLPAMNTTSNKQPHVVDEDQQMGLMLPLMGAIIDISEQEHLVAEWHQHDGPDSGGLEQANAAGALALMGDIENKLCGSKIILGDVLGAGSFGRVFRGTLESGEQFAVKIIDHGIETLEAIARETSISMKVAHPNVVRTLHYFTTLNQDQAGGPAGPAGTRRHKDQKQLEGPPSQQMSQRSRVTGWLSWGDKPPLEGALAATAAASAAGARTPGQEEQEQDVGPGSKGSRGLVRRGSGHRDQGMAAGSTANSGADIFRKLGAMGGGTGGNTGSAASRWTLTGGSGQTGSRGSRGFGSKVLFKHIGAGVSGSRGRGTRAAVPGAGAEAPSTHSTWIIQELCTGGCLSAQLHRERTAAKQAAAAQAAVLSEVQGAAAYAPLGTCDAAQSAWAQEVGVEGKIAEDNGEEALALRRVLDVARGLQYLHSQGICHGDIKAQNVLIHEDESTGKTTMKLADFGLSRILTEHATHHSTRTAGTVTHAAPELLMDSRMTPATDVYAFGIFMYEAATGEKVYPGLTSAQIIMRVVFEGMRPMFAEWAVQRYSELYRGLAAQCWDGDPTRRPPLGELVAQLEAGLQQLRGDVACAAATIDGEVQEQL